MTAEGEDAGRATTAPPIVYTGPEELFGITGLRVDREHSFGAMRPGPPLDDGRLSAGALGVLIDDAMGYAMVIPRPEGHWAVSTEITLDVVGALDEATAVTAEAWAVQADSRSSYARCEVHDQRGRLLAVCSQRGRYVPIGDAGLGGTSEPSAAPSRASTLSGLISAERVDDGLELTASPGLQNALGMLHGGISICASDLATAFALDEADLAGLRPSSIRIAYARPVTAGSRISYLPRLEHRGRSLAVIEVVGSIDGRVSTLAQVIAHPRG